MSAFFIEFFGVCGNFGEVKKGYSSYECGIKIMSMYAQIQKNLADYYKIVKKQYSAKYVKEFLLGFGILCSLFVGYFLYNFYIKRREANAFGALYEVVESFEKTQYKAMSTDKQKDKTNIENAWQDTEVLLEALYKEHMGSYLAPYFLLFKSEIILEKGGTVDESRKVLEDALVQMPKHSELFDIFELKRIKMSFDSQDESVASAALQDLIEFCKSQSSVMFEEAVYTLGAYYLAQGDIAKAQETWQRLIKESSIDDKESLITSPWSKLAEEKLGSHK